MFITELNNHINKTNFDKSIINEDFKDLYNHINEQILEDAYNKSLLFSEILTNNNINFEIKNKKNIERVLQKQNNPISFKVISDLCGFRILSKNLSDIQKNYEKLSDIINSINGHIFMKNEYDNTDIIYFAYAYIPEYGYIIEFQIGHPFATYVFKRDSYLRDNKESGLLDFWSFGFYNFVKQRLINNNINSNVIMTYYDNYDQKPTKEEYDELIYLLVQ